MLREEGMATTSLEQKTAHEPQVPVFIGMLENQLSELTHAVDIIEAKVQPVCSPERSEPAVDDRVAASCPPDDLCEYAHSMQVLTAMQRSKAASHTAPSLIRQKTQKPSS